MLGDHLSATTTRKGKIVGFGESQGRGRAASGDADDSGMIAITVSGSSPRGEEGTLESAQRLVEHLNLTGGRWAPPIEVVGVQHIDATAERADGAEGSALTIQVVRALTDAAFWRSLGRSSNAAISIPVSEAAGLLKSAVEFKADKIPREIRAALTLALDATDVPGLSLDPVVDEFNSAHGGWAESLGFESVWVVGPWREMVRRLHGANG
jgi:hypothetical protein